MEKLKDPASFLLKKQLIKKSQRSKDWLKILIIQYLKPGSNLKYLNAATASPGK